MATLLPGYYFDEEKRKYFKILPNHQAPQGAKYSREALKTAAKKQRKKQPPRVADMSSPIRPSAILVHSLGGALCLRREQGVYPLHVRESIFNAWAIGLERRIYIQGQRHIFNFAIDHGTGAFLMIYDDDGLNSLNVQLPHTAYRDGCSLLSTPVPFLNSINITLSRVAIATYNTFNATNLVLTHLSDEDSFSAYIRSRSGHMPNRGQHTYSFAQQSFATAARPDATSTVLIAGGSHRTYVIKAQEAGWSLDHEQNQSATSVDWLDQHTFLTGDRSGAIRLYDIRNQGTSLRIKFPGAINHVKKLGEQTIVAAGMENNLRTYDLRSTPAVEMDELSRPHMEFMTYRNWDCHTLSSSVDVQDNLIAATTDEGQVQLFNANTGREMPMGVNHPVDSSDHRIMGLKFADKEHVRKILLQNRQGNPKGSFLLPLNYQPTPVGEPEKQRSNRTGPRGSENPHERNSGRETSRKIAEDKKGQGPKVWTGGGHRVTNTQESKMKCGQGYYADDNGDRD
ncbi:hypothetical protein MMC07_000931 [Pseudocyphellaria aurata]|nr:hypothetical protein [Pseudocyphellaria aurata]